MNQVPRKIRYSLDPIRGVLATFGHPQDRMPKTIHVAGTNGKGSTVAFITAALRALGYRVGVYTSPHLSRFHERIRIDGVDISDALWSQYEEKVRAIPESGGLTEFEVMTVMMFAYFSDQAPDFVVMETGIGGRLDATNVIVPVLSVITSIGRDHEAILGDTLDQIAWEKSGIIKHQTPVVISESSARFPVFQTRAAELNAPFVIARPFTEIPPTFHLNAEYQKANAGTAFTALQTLAKFGHIASKENHWSTAFATATFWGRFTVIQTPTQTLVIDGAHNPDGIRALITALNHHFPGQRPVVIVGILNTKSMDQMIPPLLEIATSVRYCEFSATDAIPYPDIVQAYPTVSQQPWAGHLDLPNHPLVVVCGSLYFIGALHPQFGHR